MNLFGRKGLIACIFAPAFVCDVLYLAEDRQWLVVARQGERALEGVGIFLGTPAEFGAQVPDASKVERNRELVTWRIVRATGDRFWVGCVYSGTTAMLFQKLAADESLCVATYDLLPSGKRQRLSSMQCH